MECLSFFFKENVHNSCCFHFNIDPSLPFFLSILCEQLNIIISNVCVKQEGMCPFYNFFLFLIPCFHTLLITNSGKDFVVLDGHRHRGLFLVCGMAPLCIPPRTKYTFRGYVCVLLLHVQWILVITSSLGPENFACYNENLSCQGYKNNKIRRKSEITDRQNYLVIIKAKVLFW